MQHTEPTPKSHLPRIPRPQARALPQTRPQTPPLPHPSWRAAVADHDTAKPRISAGDFWQRLGL
jgi:hypothetical protein